MAVDLPDGYTLDAPPDSSALPSGYTLDPPAPQGFMGRFNADMDKGRSAVNETQDQYDRGDIGLPEATLRDSGQVAKGVVNTIGNAINSVIPQSVDNAVKSGVNYMANDAYPGIGQLAKYGAGQYGQFATSHPNTADDIGAAANIASIIPAGHALEGAAGLVGDTVGVAIPKVKGAAIGVANLGKDMVSGISAASPDAMQDTLAGMQGKTSASYQQMRDMGVQLNPNSSQDLISSINSAMNKQKFIPALNPKTLSVVEDLKDSAQNQGLGLNDLDQYRKLLGRIAPTEDGVSAGAVKNAIDDHINNLSNRDLTNISSYSQKDLDSAIDEWGNLKNLEIHLTNSVNGKAQLAGQQGGFWRGRSITDAADDAKGLANVRGQIQNQETTIKNIEDNIKNAPNQPDNRQAVSILTQGRQQAQQGFKYQDVADILTKANGDANKIRSGLNRFVSNPDNLKGWSGDEIATLKRAANSTTLNNITNQISKFGIGGHGALTPLVGAELAGPAAPVAGTITNFGRNIVAKGRAQQLLDVIANGGKVSSADIATLSPQDGMMVARQLFLHGAKTLPMGIYNNMTRQ